MLTVLFQNINSPPPHAEELLRDLILSVKLLVNTANPQILQKSFLKDLYGFCGQAVNLIILLIFGKHSYNDFQISL